MVRVRPGALFLACVVALCVLAIGDVSVASAGMRASVSSGPFRSNEGGAVFVETTSVPVGARLVVRPELGGDTWPHGLPTYDFYLVPGGDGAGMLNGTPPREVYYELRDLSSQSCCPHGFVSWTRPDDALAHRAPSEVQAPAPEDRAENIDLVWVYHWKEGAQQPATPEERAAFDDAREQALHARIAFLPQFDPGYPTVFTASAARAHPAFFGAMAALAVVAAGCAIAWAVQLRRADVLVQDAQGAESLLRLYDAGGAYLAATRDLLLGSLAVVVGVSLHLVLMEAPSPTYTLLDLSGITGPWWRVLSFALVLVYTAIAVVWTYAVVRVHRALRRWRARQTRRPPPLDL